MILRILEEDNITLYINFHLPEGLLLKMLNLL